MAAPVTFVPPRQWPEDGQLPLEVARKDNLVIWRTERIIVQEELSSNLVAIERAARLKYVPGAAVICGEPCALSYSLLRSWPGQGYDLVE